MSYKSDHEFRTDLWNQVTRGLDKDLVKKAHKYLGDNYQEEKDEMDYDQLLGVVKEVMSDYPEYLWNGQKWIES